MAIYYTFAACFARDVSAITHLIVPHLPDKFYQEHGVTPHGDTEHILSTEALWINIQATAGYVQMIRKRRPGLSETITEATFGFLEDATVTFRPYDDIRTPDDDALGVIQTIQIVATLLQHTHGPAAFRIEDVGLLLRQDQIIILSQQAQFWNETNARHFGVALTEIDDFQVLLERMTTPEQQPALHFWRTHPAPERLSPEEIFAQGLDVGRTMAAGLEAVIANHLETQRPIVLEGDFLHPALAAQTHFADQPNNGRVQALFLVEDDEAQLLANFAAREPDSDPQTTRARVSWLYSQWLTQQANLYGIPALPARPWDTVLDRVLAAIS